MHGSSSLNASESLVTGSFCFVVSNPAIASSSTAPELIEPPEYVCVSGYFMPPPEASLLNSRNGRTSHCFGCELPMPHALSAIWNLPLLKSGSAVELIAPRGVSFRPHLPSASDMYVAAADQSEKSLGKEKSNSSFLPSFAQTPSLPLA